MTKFVVSLTIVNIDAFDSRPTLISQRKNLPRQCRPIVFSVGENSCLDKVIDFRFEFGNCHREKYISEMQVCRAWTYFDNMPGVQRPNVIPSAIKPSACI